MTNGPCLNDLHIISHIESFVNSFLEKTFKNFPPTLRRGIFRLGLRDQQPPQQQENRRTMRMIQIQLLLSNTLHRQLFIVNLPKYEVGEGCSLSPLSLYVDWWRTFMNPSCSCRFFANDSEQNFGKRLDKISWMVYNICVRTHICGYSLMVKLQLPKLAMRVRFPLLAPKEKDTIRCPFLLEKANGREKLLQTARYGFPF